MLSQNTKKSIILTALVAASNASAALESQMEVAAFERATVAYVQSAELAQTKVGRIESLTQQEVALLQALDAVKSPSWSAEHAQE
jgi:hydroxyacyl-ACP dehydratase HTD2-like protein with hotdog domain